MSAANPDAEIGVRYHIRYGSRTGEGGYLPSQYISASATEKGFLSFLSKGDSDHDYIKVAIINLHYLRLLRVPVHTVAQDIREENGINYMKNEDVARNYALAFDEVLIEGYIPNICFMRVFQGRRQDFENYYRYVIECIEMK